MKFYFPGQSRSWANTLARLHCSCGSRVTAAASQLRLAPHRALTKVKSFGFRPKYQSRPFQRQNFVRRSNNTVWIHVLRCSCLPLLVMKDIDQASVASSDVAVVIGLVDTSKTAETKWWPKGKSKVRYTCIFYQWEISILKFLLTKQHAGHHPRKFNKYGRA